MRIVPRRRPVPGIFRDVKAHPHMALCRKMINFVRLEPRKKLDEIRRVRYVAVMQKQLDSLYMRILIKVINAPGIEC